MSSRHRCWARFAECCAMFRRNCGRIRWRRRSQPIRIADFEKAISTAACQAIGVETSGRPAATALNNNGLYLPLRPSRGNYYEAGLTKAIGAKVRLDASYFRRDIRNFADDDLLVNTGVGFPIAFHSAQIRGVEAKLEIPHW